MARHSRDGSPAPQDPDDWLRADVDQPGVRPGAANLLEIPDRQRNWQASTLAFGSAGARRAGRYGGAGSDRFGHHATGVQSRSALDRRTARKSSSPYRTPAGRIL